MTIDEVKEGDICVLDESVEYYLNPNKPYEVLVLWHGHNCQPLVTKVNEYRPFWTTYSQLIEIKGHIELHKAIKSLEAWQSVRQEIEKIKLSGFVTDGEVHTNSCKQKTGLTIKTEVLAIIDKHIREVQHDD